MAIDYIHQSTGEKVIKEPWRWAALYKDGTRLNQFDIIDSRATFNTFDSIDSDGVAEFSLVHDTYNPISFVLPENARPVHFYRHRIIHEEFIDHASGETMVREMKLKLWVIGFRVEKQYWLAYVEENGRVTISNDYNLFKVGEI